MDFVFRFRDHVLSHTVYKPGGVTETSHCCLSSCHDLQVSRLYYVIVACFLTTTSRASPLHSCLLLLLIAQYWDEQLPPRCRVRRRGGRRLNRWSMQWAAQRRLAIGLNVCAMHIAMQVICCISEVRSQCNALVCAHRALWSFRRWIGCRRWFAMCRRAAQTHRGCFW
jgi:hypothetical protein